MMAQRKDSLWSCDGLLHEYAPSGEMGESATMNCEDWYSLNAKYYHKLLQWLKQPQAAV